MPNSIAWAQHADTMVLVHAEIPVSDTEWAAYVGDLVKNRAVRILVFSSGAGPNAKQRKLMNETLELRASMVKTAVVTDSRIARTIVGLIALFHDHIRAFPPSDVRGALVHLERTNVEAELLGLAQELRQRFTLAA